MFRRRSTLSLKGLKLPLMVEKTREEQDQKAIWEGGSTQVSKEKFVKKKEKKKEVSTIPRKEEKNCPPKGGVPPTLGGGVSS